MNTTRTIRPAGLLAVLLLVLTACGGRGTTDAGSTPSRTEASGTGASGSEATREEAASFPVTIEHKFGTTEIVERPGRVVALGFQEQDALLALGVTPVAVRYWFGEEPNAVFPWAQDELGDAEPEVLNMPFGELDYEKIAALEPDLISGVYSGITDQEYRRLSEIAPTIAQTDDYVDFGMPWQQMTVMVGRAVGREQQARDLVADVEAQFAAVREAHPAWDGARIAVASGPGEGEDQYSIYASEDARSRAFTNLGFEVPAELDDITGESFFARISREQAGLLDRDLIVFHQMQFVDGGREAITGDPLLSGLDAMQDGRVVFIGGRLDDALQFSTVLSLPFLLEELVPMVEAAMDGDPTTEIDAGA